MSYDRCVRTLVLIMVFMAPLFPLDRGESVTPATLTDHYLLVANYDMRTGQPLLNIVTATQTPRPVVCDVDFRNDTTVAITLHLPYTWPDRGHALPTNRLPAQSFHLRLLTGADSAHYIIEFEPKAAHLRAVAVEPVELVEVAPLSAYPPNTVMIQLDGSDHSLATELRQALQAIGEERVLKPGYYSGVPRWIGVNRLGAKQYNETVDGILLAIELRDALSAETYSALKSLVDGHSLTWFHPPLDADQ